MKNEILKKNIKKKMKHIKKDPIQRLEFYKLISKKLSVGFSKRNNQTQLHPKKDDANLNQNEPGYLFFEESFYESFSLFVDGLNLGAVFAFSDPSHFILNLTTS